MFNFYSKNLMIRSLIVLSIFLSFSKNGFSQNIYNYNRSSLHLVLIDQGKYFGNEYLRGAFFQQAFPDNYDQHTIADSILFISDYMTYQEKIQSQKERRKKTPTFLKTNAGNITKGITQILGEDDELINEYVNDYIDEKEIARKLVAKWFLRDSLGTFSMDEVMKRGGYNASLIEARTAENSAMGYNLLGDAGIELVNNTFVLFTNLNLVDNDPFIDELRFSTSGRWNTMKKGRFTSLADKAKSKVVDKLKNGFTIWTTGYLYRLKWTKEIENIFFSEFWISRNGIDEDRKARFDESDIFELEFIGHTYAQSLVTEKLLQEEEEETIVTRATIRNVESCFAKLQKQYDEFKPIVPLLSTDPLSARIGKKEGLEGNEKFEILEITENPETGIQSLSRVKTIKVDKKKIWDNRFGAVELLESLGEKQIDRTHFKGSSSKIRKGMLIRQIK